MSPSDRQKKEFERILPLAGQGVAEAVEKLAREMVARARLVDGGGFFGADCQSPCKLTLRSADRRHLCTVCGRAVQVNTGTLFWGVVDILPVLDCIQRIKLLDERPFPRIWAGEWGMTSAKAQVLVSEVSGLADDAIEVLITETLLRHKDIIEDPSYDEVGVQRIIEAFVSEYQALRSR